MGNETFYGDGQSSKWGPIYIKWLFQLRDCPLARATSDERVKHLSLCVKKVRSDAVSAYLPQPRANFVISYKDSSLLFLYDNREIKHDVYGRRQAAKMISDFLFSCNP